MDKNLTILEKVLLMGLLPLLGGTNNLKQAVIIAVSAVMISIIIKFISDHFTAEKDFKWYLLIGLGIALSYVFYISIINALPSLELYVNNYLLLLGVTPLIYVGAGGEEENFFSYQKDFFIMMIFVGALRQILGQGMIFGIQLTKAGYPPFGFVEDFPGAFLIVSIIYLMVELSRKDKGNRINETEEKGDEQLV
ncbi:MAG: hypothetical protein ACQESS_11850 [Bacillota bacterium]